MKKKHTDNNELDGEEIVQSLKSALCKTFVYRGRASRLEFWSYVLLYVPFLYCVSYLVGFLLGGMLLVDAEVLDQIVTMIAVIFSLPLFSLQTRRLHDIGKSGWWQLVVWVPIVSLLNLYWYCKKGDQNKNSFG